MDFKGFYDEIIFDVDKPILKSYTGKQGDTKSRGLYVTVTQKNAVIDDLTGLSMTFYCEKPDKTRVYQDAIKDGNRFRVDLANQVFAVPGILDCELTLKGANGERITSKTFKMRVDRSLVDNSIVSEDERGVIDDALEFVEEYVPRLELIDIDSLENYDSELKQNKVKISTVEKELNDYKATMQQINIHQSPTQKASGHGIISLPPNAAEGQVSSVGIKGLTVTNLAKNGNFANGTDGWGFSNSTLSAKDNTLIVTARDAYRYAQAIQGVNDRLVGHKYYGKAKVRVTNNDCEQLNLTIAGTRESVVSPSANQWYTISAHGVATSEGALIVITQVYETAEIAKGKIMELQEVMAIDLTATFGAGNEPTKEECDKIFANWFDGTKSTVGSARVKSVGKNLFDGELEYGYISNETGRNVNDSSSAIRSKNFIKVKPNTQYSISNDNNYRHFIYFYDASKNFIRLLSDANLFTTDIDTHYIRFRTSVYNVENNLNTNFQLEKGDTSTEYEPYKESNAYVIATDKDTGKILELRSLPNGTKDEINVTDRKLIKRIGEKSNIANGMVIDFADMAEGGTYYAWNDDGETEAGVKGDTLGIDATTLTYQLAEPVEIPVQVSGTLTSYPNGTVYIEPFVADAGVYTDKIKVLHQDLPIKAIEKLSKVDFMTGVETELDIDQAEISEDKLSFTHPDLSEGDIVFFEYEYDVESTDGEAEVEFYDSRYVVKDDVTGKFYKWNVKVSNGTPTIEVVEV